jgi:hypothetical protein
MIYRPRRGARCIETDPVSHTGAMKLNRRLFTLVAVAASAISTLAVTPPVSASPVSSTLVIKAAGIESFDFLNTTYDTDALGFDEGIVTVSNGSYQRGDCSTGDCFYFEVSKPVFGNFDGSGTSEAALRTLVNTGGTGQFTDVAVFRFNSSTGKPTLAATAGIGDRADGGIYRFASSKNRLIVERYANAEGACCPTAIERGEYTLGSKGLVRKGRLAKRALVYLGSQGEIKFLRGTNSATVEGNGVDAASATIGAGKKQTLTIAMESAPAGSLATKITVSLNGSELGSVTSGGTVKIKLPKSAKYTLTESPVGTVTADSFADFTALVTIK